jgi:biopolymer transport protein ExbD
VARPNLAVEFERAAAQTPDATLVVQADRAVPHGDVVAIMSAAMDAGLQRVSIATRPTDREVPGE